MVELAKSLAKPCCRAEEIVSTSYSFPPIVAFCTKPCAATKGTTAKSAAMYFMMAIFVLPSSPPSLATYLYDH